MSKFTSFLFLLLFVVHSTSAASARSCYFPDGNNATKDTPCKSATVSTCCQEGATCLDNGLCFDPFGSAVGGYIRGSCTDKSWASSSCPQYCTYGKISTSPQLLTQANPRSQTTQQQASTTPSPTPASSAAATQATAAKATRSPIATAKPAMAPSPSQAT